MGLEDNLDCIYAAKGFSEYLTVNRPGPPKEWKKITRMWRVGDALESAIEGVHSAYLSVFDRKGYKAKKESMRREEENRNELWEAKKKDDEEHNTYLEQNGLLTDDAKDAWVIAHYAGMCMGRYVRHNTHNMPKDEPWKTDRQSIDIMVRAGVRDGIRIVRGQHWIAIKGVETPEIVNKDFEDKAIEWLKEEVYSRLDIGKPFLLLEAVAVKEKDGIVYMNPWFER
jgi:hypothetical protein